MSVTSQPQTAPRTRQAHPTQAPQGSPNTATIGEGVRPVGATHAVRDSAVIGLGLVVLGAGFGLVVTATGLAWWWAPVISFIIYAGSMEFVLVGLLAAAMPLASIAMTTFFVNSRHLFYGLAFPLHQVRRRTAKAYSVYALTDESYALTTTHSKAKLTGRYIVTMQVLLHSTWVLGGLIGALAGSSLLGELHGAEFVLTALFVVLTVDAYRASPDRVTVAVALTCTAVAAVVAPSHLLIVAVSGFALSLVARHWNRSVRV